MEIRPSRRYPTLRGPPLIDETRHGLSSSRTALVILRAQQGPEGSL
jgi:hypothetical protein